MKKNLTTEELISALQLFPIYVSTTEIKTIYDLREWCEVHHIRLGEIKVEGSHNPLDPPFISFNDDVDCAFNYLLGAWFKKEKDAVLFKLRWL